MLSQLDSRLRRSMPAVPTRPRRRAREPGMARLSIEALEVRWLLNASPLAYSQHEVEPNETIDQAWDVGSLSQPAEVSGSIGNGPDGAADITWYRFNLADPSRVDLDLSTSAGGLPFASVLSLYNSDPNDYSDPYNVGGHRLLAQVEANPSNGAADYVQDLGPGDYFVAVSGAGNRDFSPVIAASGFNGATGSYELTIRATDLGLAAEGPTVLSSDPAAGAVLDGSPLAIRLELSGPLDPNSILPGQTVQLLSSKDGTVGAGTSDPVALASVNFSATADELQLFPLAPLAPGKYVIWLSGDSSSGQAVLTDPNGVPLGENSAHRAGADEFFSFEVVGIDGIAGATGSDDAASSARNLGNVAGAGLIQVDGAIGDDPSFDPSLSPDPTNPDPQFIPANQVDLYHFQITGPGRYAMLAEVFAGRIGSPLDPGISLFELDPSDGELVFLAGNNNTINPTQGTDGSVPLFTDSVLNAGLTAGDYYVAVADGSNTPSPIESQMPDSPGIFDPNQPGSAQLGWSTGPYVLNLLVQPSPNPPQVLVSSPSSGQVFDKPPTQLTVRFSEPINIELLAYQAFETSAQTTLPQVFVEADDGTRYYPRFLSYDRATNQATFQMLDGLPDGSYALHLSGPGGLIDLGGNPIVGNDPSGDYVIPFQVEGPKRDISGEMTDGYTIVSHAAQGVPQDLGVLFPNEIQAGVTVVRGPDAGASAALPTMEDDYLIQVLQSQNYSFTLSGDDLPAGAQVTMSNASGQPIPLLASIDGQEFFGRLIAGTYTVSVGGSTARESASVYYQLTINLVGQQDNAPPLVSGPAPALQIHLDGIETTTMAVPVSVSVSVGSPGGGAVAGASSTFQPGLANAAFAQNQAMGGLSSLGVSPIGGVVIESGLAASPIQIALNVPATPVSSGLVSLITLTQVFSWNGEGEGLEELNALAPTVTDAIAAAPTIDQAELSGHPEPLRLPTQPALTLNDAGPLVQETRPNAAKGAIPASDIAAELLAVPGLAVLERDETNTVSVNRVFRLVITGAIVTAAFRWRPAFHGLKWRKRARAESSRIAGPISRHRSHGSMTVTWLPGGKNCGSPVGIGRAVQPAGSSRSRDAR
jgi:methionine-rich copper-binding protein CopC